MKTSSFYELEIFYVDRAGDCRTQGFTCESEEECNEKVKEFAKKTNFRIYKYSIIHYANYYLDN